MAHNDNVVHSSGAYNSRYFLVCVVYTACRYPTPSRKACISRYLCVVYTGKCIMFVSKEACNSRYLCAVYTVKNHAIEPASAGIYGWYIPFHIIRFQNYQPASAGIYGWYIPRYTTCSYIICTKLKIFLAFLQEKRLLSQPFFNTIFQNQILFFQFPYLILILH